MSKTDITPVRTERRDAAENRQRILKAAHKLFEEFGVENVSMNQIATEAEIGPGTLYRRFRNKSELCQELIKDHLDLLFDGIETYMNENRDEPPRERLKGLLRLFIRFREMKAQLLSGVEESASPARKRPLSQNPVYNELHKLFVELLDEIAASEPSRSPAPNSVFKADVLMMALLRDSYHFQRDVRGYAPEMILEQLILTFLPEE
ncbi:TetR/AcrR family transcriptional regulator [Gorillibacterium massiliense]|uniref:TetR/AcrR family transcriptional regulator n=1 Tax=Gorillibacterium massiliense TaxID=1280390 RepID=UPI0004B3EFB7|nr:TetR/AcrR family transcriptional regulator [Gorillibacterium massiliense]